MQIAVRKAFLRQECATAVKDPSNEISQSVLEQYSCCTFDKSELHQHRGIRGRCVNK